MSGYLLNFIVYTAAMIGVIFLAVFAYKKFSYTGVSKSKFLNIEDCISLAPRKNLYVIRAGKERFLVASDAERTSLISKLDENTILPEKEIHQIKDKVERKSSVDDLPTIVNFKTKTKDAQTVLKNIVNNRG